MLKHLNKGGILDGQLSTPRNLIIKTDRNPRQGGAPPFIEIGNRGCHVEIMKIGFGPPSPFPIPSRNLV